MKSPTSLLLMAALWDSPVYGAVVNPRQQPNPKPNGLGLLPPYLSINASIGIITSSESTSSSTLTPAQLTSVSSEELQSASSSSPSSTPFTSSFTTESSSLSSPLTISNSSTPISTSSSTHNSTVPSSSHHRTFTPPQPKTPPNGTFSTNPRLPTTFHTKTTVTRSGAAFTTVFPLHPSFSSPGEAQGPNATEKCTPLMDGLVVSVFDIRYTSTITIDANETHLLALFPKPTTSKYCSNEPDMPGPYSSGQTTRSNGWNPMPTGPFPSTEDGHIGGSKTRPAESPAPTATQKHELTTVTIITTPKGPSVSVKNPPPVPDYSQTWGNKPGGVNGHPTGNGGGGHGGKLPDGASPPEPTFTLTAIGTSVIINGQTFTGIGPFQTSVVTVGNNVFTIGPDSVVGGGASIRRPLPGQVTRAIGGVPVTMAGDIAIVGGQTLTLPPSPSVTNINGHDITLGPGGVTVNGQIFTRDAPKPSNWVVTGGEMMTVAGQSIVVLHSTTLTYGPGIPEKVTAINGETISIEPEGVSVHGKSLGGPKANPTDTTYELVGAATIGKIPPSMIVVNGKTYSVGPGVGLKTIMAGDQTLTVGPFGVILGSVTTSFPLDATMVTTFTATRTNDEIPRETGNVDDEDSAGMALQPSKRLGAMILGIAIGVLVLG